MRIGVLGVPAVRPTKRRVPVPAVRTFVDHVGKVRGLIEHAGGACRRAARPGAAADADGAVEGRGVEVVFAVRRDPLTHRRHLIRVAQILAAAFE